MDRATLRLFISHSHQDKLLAQALRELIVRVFPQGERPAVSVVFSSDDAPDGGVAAGARWFDWIRRVVNEADVCVVILTADSVSAPWLTWEAGAVSGVALAGGSRAEGEQRRAVVIPLLFGVSVDKIPAAPLQQQQALNGEESVDVLKLLVTLNRLSTGEDRAQDASRKRAVSRFVRDSAGALRARRHARPASVQLPEGTLIRFVSSVNGLTLEPRDGEIADGVRLESGRFTGDEFQGWLLYLVERDLYRIVTFDSSKCISVENDSLRQGATIVLWTYEQHETQHWRINRDPRTNTVRIINGKSGRCLEPRADRQVVQVTATNNLDQDWWMLAEPVLRQQ